MKLNDLKNRIIGTVRLVLGDDPNVTHELCINPIDASKDSKDHDKEICDLLDKLQKEGNDRN